MLGWAVFGVSRWSGIERCGSAGLGDENEEDPEIRVDGSADGCTDSWADELSTIHQQKLHTQS